MNDHNACDKHICVQVVCLVTINLLTNSSKIKNEISNELENNNIFGLNYND